MHGKWHIACLVVVGHVHVKYLHGTLLLIIEFNQWSFGASEHVHALFGNNNAQQQTISIQISVCFFKGLLITVLWCLADRFL